MRKRNNQKEHSIIEKVFKGTLITYLLNSLTWGIGALIDGAVIGNFLGVDSVAAFNPVERHKMISVQEDPTKNIGIRMVIGMARDVQYLSTMSTNNLIICI